MAYVFGEPAPQRTRAEIVRSADSLRRRATGAAACRCARSRGTSLGLYHGASGRARVAADRSPTPGCSRAPDRELFLRALAEVEPQADSGRSPDELLSSRHARRRCRRGRCCRNPDPPACRAPVPAPARSSPARSARFCRRRIELPLHAIGHGVSRDAAQRRDHLADADQNSRDVDRARMRELRGRRLVADDASWRSPCAARTPTCASSRATGQIASTPASGSRMMPLANDDAALFGLPGRTVTVGRRRLRPSMKPLRVMS